MSLEDGAVDVAASFAIVEAKRRGAEEVSADHMLLGCLQAIARFGVAQIGPWIFDLEALGVDWLDVPQRRGQKVSYSQSAVEAFDHAARIARANGSRIVDIDHLLATFAAQEDGLMGQLKRSHGISSGTWRAAVAQLTSKDTAQGKEERPPLHPEANRDYLTPEQAAEALSVHVQTLRAYVRSGKLPALRLAGERSIRIRRTDLEKVLDPVQPEK